jgi:hypothetical protein
MNKSKMTYGIVAITTIVLMFATTIGSTMTQADARVGPVDQRAQADQRAAEQSADQVTRGLVNVVVGNAGVQVAVPANVAACVICG